MRNRLHVHCWAATQNNNNMRWATGKGKAMKEKKAAAPAATTTRERPYKNDGPNSRCNNTKQQQHSMLSDVFLFDILQTAGHSNGGVIVIPELTQICTAERKTEKKKEECFLYEAKKKESLSSPLFMVIVKGGFFF